MGDATFSKGERVVIIPTTAYHGYFVDHRGAVESVINNRWIVVHFDEPRDHDVSALFAIHHLAKETAS